VKIPFLDKIFRREPEAPPLPAVSEEHRFEREQFAAVLESFQATRIADRLSVLDVFLATEEHISAFRLSELVRQRHPELADRTFVNETMAMFCQFGFATRLEFANQDVLYEHQHLGKHHDHFICTRCGAIQEFEDDSLERLQMHIAKGFQFHPLQHRTEIYGLCGGCMGQREPTLPLAMAANGERVHVMRINGDRTVQARLATLGIRVGSCIEVVSNHGSGPFVVIAAGARLALGQDLVGGIEVGHACAHSEDDGP